MRRPTQYFPPFLGLQKEGEVGWDQARNKMQLQLRSLLRTVGICNTILMALSVSTSVIN